MNKAIETGIAVAGVQNGTHFELRPTFEGHRYVVVSCAHMPGMVTETMIFPANQYGEVMCYDELASVKAIDVAEVFRQLGDYAIIPFVPKPPELVTTSIMVGDIPVLQWRWRKRK